MACRGFLQCLLKLFNLALCVVGALLLVLSISLLVRESSGRGTTPPPPSSLSLDVALALAESEHPHLVLLSHPSPRISRGPSLKLHGRSRPLGASDSLSSGLGEPKLPELWFTYLLIAVGAYITLLTLVGAVAAESNVGCCLSTYQFGLCFLLLLQLVGAMLVWLEEVPLDPTGEYDRQRKFVLDNLELCKLGALCLLLVEGTALLLAMMLRAIQADEASAVEDEEDYVVVPRTQLRLQQQQQQRRMTYSQPLLSPGHLSQQPSQSGSSTAAGATTALAATGSNPSPQPAASAAGAWGHTETWRARLMEKYGMDPSELQYAAADSRGPGPARTPAAVAALPNARETSTKTCSVM